MFNSDDMADEIGRAAPNGPADTMPDLLPVRGAGAVSETEQDDVGGEGGREVRRSVEGSVYPAGWPAFAKQVKDEAGWTCVRCQHPHDPANGYTLTVHHATMDKSEPFEHWWAFLPLCQRCHLSIQAKVVLDRPWVMAEHSAWFKVYAAGFYAYKYLGIVLSRSEVETRLEELLRLEREAVLV